MWPHLNFVTATGVDRDCSRWLSSRWWSCSTSRRHRVVFVVVEHALDCCVWLTGWPDGGDL
jgi:hypothetical protein